MEDKDDHFKSPNKGAAAIDETRDLNTSTKPTFNINDALVYVGGFGKM